MSQYVYTMNRVSKVVPPNRTLIKDVSLSFFPGAKIGVLGLNGAGKSTVLRIMAGVDTEFDGEARAQPGIRIGYLSQEPELPEDETVREAVMEGMASLRDLLKRFDEISEAFAKPMSDAIGAGTDPKSSAADRFEQAKRASGVGNALWFAHPDLRLLVANPGTLVQLTGCRPEGDWRFAWPDLRVAADYVLGDRSGLRPLTAQAALLLPDEGRVAITYRCWFRFITDSPDTERSIRLRIAD